MNIMTRLTFDGDFCDISMCRFVPGGSFCEDGDCSQRRVWERLKSIEDILGSDYNLDRLRELAEADQNGQWVAVRRTNASTAYQCSVCGRRVSVMNTGAAVWDHYPYCHCGAKMDADA